MTPMTSKSFASESSPFKSSGVKSIEALISLRARPREEDADADAPAHAPLDVDPAAAAAAEAEGRSSCGMRDTCPRAARNTWHDVVCT